MVRYLFLMCVCLFFTELDNIFAQGLKVVEVKETVSGTDAFHAPIDENGHPCGLVKIQALFPDLRFDGNVVGEVVSENNEYKVFLAQGSKLLIIKRPQVMPVIVQFPEYSIGEISSKATYVIKLKEVSYNPQKNSLAIDVKPRNAKVYIDDVLIDNENNDGGYQLLLPKGEHLCKIEAKGYRSYASVIKTGKGPQTVNAELESLLADIDISCQTSGAIILVDGEKVGVGSWKGKLPAGTYQIDVQLDGYVSHSQSIDLAEKYNCAINVPALKRAKGSLVVMTDMANAIVFIDGNQWQNPKEAKVVQTGNHIITVKAPFGYQEVEKNILVQTDSHDTIRVSLKPINEKYARAFSGDVRAMAHICHDKMESSRISDKDSTERNYWFEKLYERLDQIDKELFDMICPCTDDGYGCDMELAGIYTYYSANTEKALRILQKWNQFYPEYDSVVLEMTSIYSKLHNNEAVIKWGTRGLDICSFEGYMSSFIGYIAEACIVIGDVNRAVVIFKEHVNKDYGWEYGYMTIAVIYKGKGDCKNAVAFYRKYIQTSPSDRDREEAEKGIRDCGY